MNLKFLGLDDLRGFSKQFLFYISNISSNKYHIYNASQSRVLVAHSNKSTFEKTRSGVENDDRSKWILDEKEFVCLLNIFELH